MYRVRLVVGRDSGRARAWRALVAGALLSFAALAAFAAAEPVAAPRPAGKPPRRVLILVSFSSDFAAFSRQIGVFRTELAQALHEPLDFYEVPLELSRFEDQEGMRPFLDYLRALFETRQVDLVVSMGGTAATFVQRYRAQLFPRVPLLYASVDTRLIDPSTLGPEDAVTGVENEPLAPVETIRQLLPETENLAIIVGSSPLERYWRAEIARRIAPLENRLQVIWLDGLPLEDIRRRVATLPPRTAVFFSLYFLDANGVPYAQDRALGEIHAVSNAPIFGLFDYQLGLGVVGGRMLPFEKIGSEAASAAVRLLQGEPPASVRLPPVRPAAPRFDARELRRWRIPESRLPPGSEVLFRSQPIWRPYVWEIATIIAILGLQASLIAVLVIHRARRRDAEREVRALHGRLLTAYEQERRRLARELHDDVTQRLARLAIDGAQVERLGSSTADGAQALYQMRGELSRLGRDIHALSRRLHPSILDDLGLAEAVRSETEHFSRSGFATVDLYLDGAPPWVPSDVGLGFFRVVQEALRNVQQHAHATRVEIALEAKAGGIELLVTDDGVGFDPETPRSLHGIGLVGMRERLHLIGGWLTIESVTGRGTKVRAWAPLGERAA